MISHSHDDHVEHRTRFIPLRILGFTVLGVSMAVIFAFAFGWLVMLLWNHLMPSLFGLTVITYWQAVGLLVLAKLLFGGFGHHCGHPHKNNHHPNLRRAFGCQSGEERRPEEGRRPDSPRV